MKEEEGEVFSFLCRDTPRLLLSLTTLRYAATKKAVRHEERALASERCGRSGENSRAAALRSREASAVALLLVRCVRGGSSVGAYENGVFVMVPTPAVTPSS